MSTSNQNRKAPEKNALSVYYFVVNGLLKSLVYKVSFSMTPYVNALFLANIITVISMLYHTYKASCLLPAESLRYE